MEEGQHIQIIAHNNLKERFRRYIRLRRSLAKYMSQPLSELPSDSSDFVWPTKTFEDELSISIGGVELILKHFEGETDDQLLVWLPQEEILFSADYYQGFMPNAGNGKRVQRNVFEWANALEYMASLKPSILIPSHGDPIIEGEEARNALTVHAELLHYIHDYTVESLNQGLRKDQIIHSFELNPVYANHPLLEEKYVAAADICKMVIKQYTGWWNDLPSSWRPASLETQAHSMVELAGGIEQLIDHIEVLKEDDLRLAAHFADWAFFAHPNHPNVLEISMEIYRNRILDPKAVTQEMLVYLDHMALLRSKLN